MKNIYFNILLPVGARIIALLIAGLTLFCCCEDFLGLGGQKENEESKETVKKIAINVMDARGKTGETEVWITGYVVGGDLTSSKVKFEGPFKSATCLAIASDSTCTVRDSCMSVQLSKGNIRDALNLPAHPELLKKKIYIKGDIVSAYYGMPGVQNISNCFTE